MLQKPDPERKAEKATRQENKSGLLEQYVVPADIKHLYRHSEKVSEDRQSRFHVGLAQKFPGYSPTRALRASRSFSRNRVCPYSGDY